MQNGKEKTHFWVIGTAFPLPNKDGFSCKLWTRLLPTDELVLLVHEDRDQREPAAADAPPDNDDLPF